MAIDRKYGRVTLERGDIGEDEPVFILRAKDRLAPGAIEDYADRCEDEGSPPHHVEGVLASKAAFEAWQAEHPTQVPQSAAQAP